MSPRPYRMGRRRAGVDEGRQRILEAARALVGGRGDLGPVSMDAVAQKAGVARMTVYHQFRSRAGLLEALADHLAERGGMARMRAVFQEPDAEQAFRSLVRTFVTFWSTDRDTLRRMRALAVVFPGRGPGPRQRDAWRRQAVETLLVRASGEARVDPGRADLITALTGFEVYDALATGSRTTEQVAQLVGDLVVQVALGPARRASTHPPPSRPVRSARGRRTAARPT